MKLSAITVAFAATLLAQVCEVAAKGAKKSSKKDKAKKGCFLEKGMTYFDEFGDSDTILQEGAEEGLGDRYLWNNALLLPGTDEVIGRVSGSCVRTVQSGTGDFDWLCNAFYTFEDGKLSVSGDLSDVATNAITGGTGCYTNVAGMTTITFPEDGNINGLWQHEVYLIMN